MGSSGDINGDNALFIECLGLGCRQDIVGYRILFLYATKHIFKLST